MSDLEPANKLTDAELIRELEHWGQKHNSRMVCSALTVQRKSEREQRAKLGSALVTGMVLSIISVAWFANSKRHDVQSLSVATKTPTVSKSVLVESEPQLLMQSIQRRTQDIESRIQGWNERREYQLQIDREFESLNAKLRDYQRLAIRNSIVLNHRP